jgi:hypothetical protein
MTTEPDAREAAWFAVHEALPARWTLGPASYYADRNAWVVTAVGPHPGRGKLPQSVSGTGAHEVAALPDLDDRLRGVRLPHDAGRMDDLRRRLRLAYIEGADAWSRQHIGRAITGRRTSVRRRSLRSVAGTLPAVDSMACERPRQPAPVPP